MTTKEAVRKAARRLSKARAAYYEAVTDYLLVNRWFKWQEKGQPPMFREHWDSLWYSLEDALSKQLSNERVKDERNASKDRL